MQSCVFLVASNHLLKCHVPLGPPRILKLEKKSWTKNSIYAPESGKGRCIFDTAIGFNVGPRVFFLPSTLFSYLRSVITIQFSAGAYICALPSWILQTLWRKILNEKPLNVRTYFRASVNSGKFGLVKRILVYMAQKNSSHWNYSHCWRSRFRR